MKKLVTIALIGICAVSVALGLYDKGWGKTVAVTATPGRISGQFTANTVSVKNKGPESVFTLVDCTAAEFDTRYAAGTTIEIESGDTFTYNCEGKDSIESICYRTAVNPATVKLGTF